MSDIPKVDLSMTETETILKQCMQARPDVWGKILSADELTEYQRWMTSDYGNFPGSESIAQDMAEFPNIARRFDLPALITSFSTSYTEHQSRIWENSEILPNYDISVGRMLRYFPAHWHTNDSFEIYYSLSGTCPIYFENEVIQVKPGTVLIVAPSVLHASPCYSDDQVLLFYLIRSSTFDQVFWDLLSSDNLMSQFFRQALNDAQSTAYLHFETGADTDILGILLRILQEYKIIQRYGSQMLNALMSEFFVLLLRRYEGTARLPRTKEFFWKHEFSGILTYIQANFASASQTNVAEHFHYSERQIGRIVQNYTGLTYAQLVLKLRMEQAAKLLQQSTASIDSIAASVGYSTSCSFYRAFSKYYGCTPREYAKQSAKQDMAAGLD